MLIDNGKGLVYLSDPHLITLHSFMDGFIDADKIDYLERDALNCGVAYGKFDRPDLIDNLTIVKNKNNIESIGVLRKGIQALESFILARYYMFNQVYMNPSERILRYQYCKEMKTLLPDGKYPNDIKKFLNLDDTKYAKKLKFLQNNKYKLIFDSEFDIKLKSLIDKNLGRYLICDTPRKPIFRKDSKDADITIVDEITGIKKPCTEVSPILKGINFACIHKLRYYALEENANEIKQELLKLIKEVV